MQPQSSSLAKSRAAVAGAGGVDASGVPPAPTTDSWDNEPVVSEGCVYQVLVLHVILWVLILP